MKKLFTLLVAILLTCSSTLAFAKTNNSTSLSQSGVDSKALTQQLGKVVSSSVEKQIQALYDQRSNLVISNDPDKTNKSNAIENQLQNLGVNKLSTDQVNALIQSKNSSSSAITPNVALPTSSNVYWTTYRTNYSDTAGFAYEIQHVVAQPNPGYSSSLCGTIAAASKQSVDVKAGVGAFLKSAGSGVVGNLPVIGQVGGAILSIFDVFKSTQSALQTTTIVNNISANYTITWGETIVFDYVKVSTQADAYQKLCMVSNKATANENATIPMWVFTNGTNGNVVVPENKNQQATIVLTPPSYDDTYTAVNCFINGTFSRQTNNTFSFTGLGGQSLGSANLLDPTYMWQVN